MGDLRWTKRGVFGVPLKALRHHIVILGSSGSGKTETLLRLAYAARQVEHLQVIYLDAKGETKRDEEMAEDNAARFVACMHLAGADRVYVFPSTHYNGWLGNPVELKNRLLSVIDYSESAFYGDVAANALDLALNAPTTPRSSSHFLANLRLDRLKAIYKDNPLQYQRVLQLDKQLLQQVHMRYQVFFDAMQGQLDGTLNYENADAVYIRVRGFTLRNEAPRLGRFFVNDFMHYVSERRKAGLLTLFIIDEFNALRMREEASLLFEQCRSFGGCLVISAQGYNGLGPHEFADRILDTCSTYILHASSNPGPITTRVGKRFKVETAWSESDDGEPARRTIRAGWDWKIPEDAVRQLETGQAYWMHKSKYQLVQSARVPLTHEQIKQAWAEIRRQEALQQELTTVEERRRQEQAQKQQAAANQQKATTTRKTTRSATSTRKKAPATKQDNPEKKAAPSVKEKIHTSPQPKIIPIPDPNDDEPDRL